MKIISVTPEEEQVVAKLRRDALRAKSGEQSAEVVRAAGTSEGAKKGWEHRYDSPSDARWDALEKTTWANIASNQAKTPRDHAIATLNHDGAANAHNHAMQAHLEQGNKKMAEEHEKSYHGHLREAKWHREQSKGYKLESSERNLTDVVHCRSHSACGPTLAASQPWVAGERVEFMWMPQGVSTICAGFRKGSIELTVQCDEFTAEAVQASLDGWREDRPKQEPFGCIEHKEQEASFRVGASCGFKWNGDGVYLAAEPTTLGAQNVNGKIHRSWSPSFTTDADYAQATEQPKGSGVLVFPEGVRGSRSNPARITGVDFCVGTLTNKPAFHSMNPVKAREVVQAGTSEGVRKAWQTRKYHSHAGFNADIVKHIGEHAGRMKDENGPGGDYHKVKFDDHVHDGSYSHAQSISDDIEESARKHKVNLDDNDHIEMLGDVMGGLKKAVHGSEARESATVTAAGTSEGAKKGWGHRQHLQSYLDTTKEWEKTNSISNDQHADYAQSNARLATSLHEKGFHDMGQVHHGISKYHSARGGHGWDHEKASKYAHDAVFDHSAKATDATTSATLHAHCAATLLQDVPDATAAEIAQYEKEVDGGGSHSDAVIRIRSERQNGFVSQGADWWKADSVTAGAPIGNKNAKKELHGLYAKLGAHLSRERGMTKEEKSSSLKWYYKNHPDKPEGFNQSVEDAFMKGSDATPTLDTIAAKHAAALAAANALATEHGAAKLTAQDVYERFSVKAAGTSEGAKKGWESRQGLSAIAGMKDGDMVSFRTQQGKQGGETHYIHRKWGEVHADQAKEIQGKIASHLLASGFKKKSATAGALHGAGSAGHNNAIYENDTHQIHIGGTGFSNRDWNAYVHVQPKSGLKASDATPEAILERIYARAGGNR